MVQNVTVLNFYVHVNKCPFKQCKRGEDHFNRPLAWFFTCFSFLACITAFQAPKTPCWACSIHFQHFYTTKGSTTYPKRRFRSPEGSKSTINFRKISSKAKKNKLLRYLSLWFWASYFFHPVSEIILLRLLIGQQIQN